MTTGGQASDEVGQLQHDIEQTREQLGETVGQLAAKADVKGMAKSKASEVSERMKSKVDMARQQAASTASTVRGQLADRTSDVKQKAQSAGQSGKDQIVSAGAPVWDATPAPVKQAVAKGAKGANERRVPIAIAVGVIVVGLLVVRRLRSQ